MYAGKCLLRDAAKHECDHHDAVNSSEKRLKHDVTPFLRSSSSLITPLKAFFVCDVASKVTEAMIAKLTVHAVANVIELFVKTVVVLQMPHFLTQGS